MRTTIDRAGRIVIPKALRDRLGLSGGEELDVAERDGRIEIVPVAGRIRLARDADGPVAVSDEAMPHLTEDEIREAIERSRR